MKVAGTPPGPAKYQGNGLARSLAVRLCIALMGCSALGSELPQPTQSSPSVSQGHKILFVARVEVQKYTPDRFPHRRLDRQIEKMIQRLFTKATR